MLTLPRLVLCNLVFHWRGNLAVLLGVAVGSAVFAGALLVGDSLRGSLRERAERQLAGVDAAALLPRPLPVKVHGVRENIAARLPGSSEAVLLLPASLQAVTGDPVNAPFLGRVTALGLLPGSRLGVADIDWGGSDRQIALSARVAEKLAVRAGDRVRLGVERVSELPRSSALAKRSAADVTAAQEFVVAAVLPPDSPAREFNLTTNPAAPLNVLVPIEALSRLVTGDRDPVANVLLSSGAPARDLDAALRASLQPEDYALEFRETGRGYLSIESGSLVLPPDAARAVGAAAAELGLRAEPTVVYIAFTLAHEKREIPYPVVAGLNPNAAKPLGPFLPKGVPALADGEVVLLEWPRSELNGLPQGSRIRLDYYDPDVEGEGTLRSTELTLRGYVPLAGAARDRDLVPSVPGVTSRGADLSKVDLPPVLTKAVFEKRVPEKPVRHPRSVFNDSNGPTPMAYVNLATATKLFSSRYGSVTSVRVAPREGESPEQTAERLRPVLLKHLDPRAAGLAFEPIRDRLLTASRGGTDFGGLFLGFSFFLIAAALMLIGLLFRLTLDRRAKEIGLLLATGYRVRTVRFMLLSEGLLLAVLGALTGLAIGVAYNRLLLTVLLSLWPDREVANLLRPHATAASFALAFGLTVLMSVVTLFFSVRWLAKVPAPALLRGESLAAASSRATQSRVSRPLVAAAAVLGLVLIATGRFVSNPDYRAMTFFAGGGLLLTAGLAAAWTWMRRTRRDIVDGRGLSALTQLGTRNASRNPARSLLTTALIAAAAFLLVAVESFRRQPGDEFLDTHGGSGGFNLVAEADAPLYHSFGEPLGRKDLINGLQSLYGGAENAGKDPRYIVAVESLDGMEAHGLRLRDGDDASCMNLFQATRPRVLGVPDSLVERGGFKFYATEAATTEDRANPWRLLTGEAPGGAIPVFCEQNTAQWMLKTTVGGEIKLPGDDGRELTLRIVGTFADSPFQSELVMADAAFTRAFPHAGGYRVFLIRTPAERQEAAARVLASAYRASGLVVTPTRERVAAYQAVIGAYLSTFQLLGGLGLLLGVLGLGVVVLRGVWERIGELALLRAVGYRTRQLQFLVLAENALLLVTGLGIGVAAAAASVAPHVVEGAAVPWLRLVGILGLVLVTGLGVASAATASILRVPVIPALRRE
jgi:putative ABC transport system permease protein